MRSIRHSITGTPTVAALVLTAAVLGAASPGAAPQAPQATTPQGSQTPGAVPSGGYAGEDTCVTCHETKSYKGTAHAETSNPRTPAATHGCESCHGPGKAHVDGGGDTTKIVNPGTAPAKEASAICTTCHDHGTRPLSNASPHDQRNVACTTCHSVHAPTGPRLTKARGSSY